MLTNTIDRARELAPGILIAVIVALAGQFIADHYGAPAMLMALVFGMALRFLSEEGRCVAGIAFSARTLLRIGVALLGIRISLALAEELGIGVIAIVVGSVVLTMGFGLAVARLFGYRYRFAVLSSGAVAICGASAAMAIAAVLPQDERSEERLVFTVVGVTLLSTVAMIVYPIIASSLQLDHRDTGIFIGATIHDVAQVVGAGFTVSQETGEVATFVKLLRVAMLAPVVIVISLLVSRLAPGEVGDKRPPLLPTFVLAFLVLATLNSLGVFPAALVEFATTLSRWALLTAIAAVGLKTSVQEILRVGPAAIGLLVAETVFIGALVLITIKLT
ncbi:putative sulfate exporter family transporter [Gammaproteobacteria bacterium]|nr:putative sulfate exporter family transporter [Gammaproteobacteria bacterium]